MIGKLALQSAHKHRLAEAVLYYNWEILESAPVHRTCKDASEQWEVAKETLLEQGMTGDEIKGKIGSPNVMVANALFKMCMEAADPQ